MKKTFAMAMMVLMGFVHVGCTSSGNNAEASNTIRSDAKVGDIITFGHYEQDNDTTNGKEAITWRVLAINGSGHYLVISEKVLDVQPYSAKSNTDATTDMTWEKSSMRVWLNSSFIDTAFTDSEKNQIILSDVPAHANPEYGTSQGNATKDKVFLLSTEEAFAHLKYNEDRQADATSYAIKRGVSLKKRLSARDSESYSQDGKYTCLQEHCFAYWWLRTPGSLSFNAVTVDNFGHIGLFGHSMDLTGDGVRPALWVNPNQSSVGIHR